MQPKKNSMDILKEAFELAFHEAHLAKEEGEIPVGAVIFSDEEIISSAHNKREQEKNPMGHAEIAAIMKAAEKISDWRLHGLSIAVTLEPCTMCAGAIINARIKNVYFSAYDKDAGAAGGKVNVFDKDTKIFGGIYEDRGKKLITEFFENHRKD